MYYQVVDTPIGPYVIVENGAGISVVEHLKSEVDSVRKAELTQMKEIETPLLKTAKKQLLEYFQGQRTEFDLPLSTKGTPFQEIVWQALREIPYGEVRSYKQLAIAIGNPKAVRAVGMANNRNPISVVTPCHRVIGSNGALVGYGGGLAVKEYLLNLEAHAITF
ncbi:methylated-DNA--[protein]-cysteine S-methyltransferase [Jeotgalibaca caeni]|uniref:methylated-DNA--[protein]-cysteine S-methyltransferase n=1 Tax=Jeotgalibaca caeni TaxID=3028623 RepID=UPI00237E5B83|nr:methylated-DNA--[protein]-cysteine S-methyltransferase [Jeotgalibaca caeni]MDE1548235.1 methylated-DNA--[protein]-cysteine S-methyltransferase [Jeotgalibaca caeni]